MTSGVCCSSQPRQSFGHQTSRYQWAQLLNEEKRLKKLATSIAIAGLLSMELLVAPSSVLAGDVKIPIPQRGLSTPTQKLNREGVSELKHGHREKAKRLFYKAYLLDPQDPFTLNNLGYIAELDGDANRALRYYALAAQQHTDAIIDQSSETALKGKPLEAAFEQVQNSNQEVSKINERAVVLLQDGRIFEARNLLRSSLQQHPQNPFLLNNLGYAMESVGDLEGALKSYSAAASLHSTERIVLTPRVKWRGKPVSEIAADNAVAVSQQISHGEGDEAATARLNLRGVAALNDNNPAAARGFFLQAYQKDSQNAFTLNNLGYVSELDGDWESAESFYEAARTGRDANDKVSYSTRPQVEGEKIDSLANDNQSDVNSTMKAMQQTRRREQKPIELMRRGAGSAENQQDVKPVPPVGVEPPALPKLPPPNSDNNQNSPQPHTEPPQGPNQK
jgi:Flp pilus assembly protein TadD